MSTVPTRMDISKKTGENTVSKLYRPYGDGYLLKVKNCQRRSSSTVPTGVDISVCIVFNTRSPKYRPYGDRYFCRKKHKSDEMRVPSLRGGYFLIAFALVGLDIVPPLRGLISLNL